MQCKYFLKESNRFDLKLDFSKSDSMLLISLQHVQILILGQENSFRSQ